MTGVTRRSAGDPSGGGGTTRCRGATVLTVRKHLLQRVPAPLVDAGLVVLAALG